MYKILYPRNSRSKSLSQRVHNPFEINASLKQHSKSNLLVKYILKINKEIRIQV